MGYELTTNFNILLLALISGLATFLGVYIGVRRKKTKENIVFGASFAAAIMIFISVFELIPSAYKASGVISSFWIFIGILILWLINMILPHIHNIEEIGEHKNKSLLKISYLLMVGMTLHNFPEGFAIASSFKTSASLGLIIVAATFFHKIPEGYALAVVSNSKKQKRLCYRSAVLSTFSIFLGALFGNILASKYIFLNPILLSITAGAMIFVSFHELIPIGYKKGQKVTFFKAVSLASLLYFLLAITF